MNNVIDLVKENQHLVPNEDTWEMRFAWLPTKTQAGNWTWLRPYMYRLK